MHNQNHFTHGEVQSIAISYISDEKPQTTIVIEVSQISLHLILFQLVSGKDDELGGFELLQNTLHELLSKRTSSTRNQYILTI